MTCEAVYTPNSYKTDLKPVWCPGCGDFGVLNSLYRALADLKCEPHDTVVVSGIGCSSRLPGFVASYGFHGVHGRALPMRMVDAQFTFREILFLGTVIEDAAHAPVASGPLFEAPQGLIVKARNEQGLFGKCPGDVTDCIEGDWFGRHLISTTVRTCDSGGAH